MAGEGDSRPIVFASHVSEDKGKIRPYLEKLMAAGINLFVDRPQDIWKTDWRKYQAQITPIECGQDWDDAIRRAFDQSDYVLTFLSPTFCKKYFSGQPAILYREVQAGISGGKLLPVLIEGTLKDIGSFNHYQLPNLTQEDDQKRVGAEHFLFADLIERIRQRRATEPPAPRPGGPRRDVSLLPNLIDRHNQENRLWQVIDPDQDWKAATFVVCGPSEEGFDEFARRLALYTLRRDDQGARLPGAVDAEPFHVVWPELFEGDETDVRWKDYVTGLARSRGLKSADVADGGAFAGKLYGKSSSWVVFSKIDEQTWANEAADMIDRWAAFWAKADKAFSDRTAQAGGFGRLIAMLCITTSKVTPTVPRPEIVPKGVLALRGFAPVKKVDVGVWWSTHGLDLTPAEQDDFDTLFQADELPMRRWVSAATDKLRARKVLK